MSTSEGLVLIKEAKGRGRDVYMHPDGLPRLGPSKVLPSGVKVSAEWRHPLLRDRVRGVWYPDLVGKIRKYPKTLEDFQATQKRASEAAKRTWERGLMAPKGLPRGWGRDMEKLAKAKEAGKQDAERILKIMVEKEMIDTDQMGDTALREALEIVRSRSADGKHVYPARERLQASKIVLEYTKAKPAAKQEIKVNTAEAWLESLVRSGE